MFCLLTTPLVLIDAETLMKAFPRDFVPKWHITAIRQSSEHSHLEFYVVIHSDVPQKPLFYF
jgi:hypothetical protein